MNPNLKSFMKLWIYQGILSLAINQKEKLYVNVYGERGVDVLSIRPI